MSNFRTLAGVGLAVLALTSAARAGAPSEGVIVCTQIRTAAQLQAINNNAKSLAGTYCLMKDIDLGSIPNWTPIGSLAPYFSGAFYGNGHVIRNLKINTAAMGYYGLFGVVVGGSIRELGVADADIKVTGANSMVGALIGVASVASSPIALNNVYSTGRVRCPVTPCDAGGLLGQAGSNMAVRNAWSAADVISGGNGGGLMGLVVSGSSTYEHIYATGNVTGSAGSLNIGGLFGVFAGNPNNNSFVVHAFAAGRVTGGTNTMTGGLIGIMLTGAYLQGGYATGAVSAGGSATAGGLIGSVDNSTVRDSFSVGPVIGASVMGGLIGEVFNTPYVASSYWDKTTSGQSSSAAGTGKTTAQMRNAVPADFSSGWGISRGLSYPFMNNPDNFTSTLATLVSNDVIFTLLPIRQSDKSQYIGNPSHTANASLAAVYTMIARAAGVSDNVATLKDVKIDKYFWHDTTQATTFAGPVTTHATLGAMKALPAKARLDASNVAGQMNLHRLVILRGTYKRGSGTATHYMLGTMYTKRGAAVSTIVANDPWTGTQVEISPVTRKVVTPKFPLATFKVNGYRPVTTLH